MSKLDDIADYAHGHDFATEMEQGTWETDTDADPMVTTSVRLPKSLLDWVRQRAAAQHVRPSVLIRQWIEQRRDDDNDTAAEDLAARVERLERAVFSDKRASLPFSG
jgi:Arc/MetJ-type ribon-helix-helix transcriptional regulator